MFFIRLDGSPNYAMMCNAIAAVTNILLDYIFIFRFGWGLMGAAFATSLGTTIGGLMTVGYLLRRSHTLHLQRIKLSRKSMQLTARNIGYMVKLGSSAFVTELSIAFMMFLGNYVFISHLGEDGVAAFSIACYFFPFDTLIITDSNHIDGEKYKAEGKVRQTFHCNLISCIFRSDKQSDNLVAEKGGEGEKTYSAEECCSVHQTEGLFDP